MTTFIVCCTSNGDYHGIHKAAFDGVRRNQKSAGAAYYSGENQGAGFDAGTDHIFPESI